MSVWSQPYLTVHDATGARVAWQLPDPLPWAAGATFDADLRTPEPLGLPTGGTVKMRWRTPEHANARSRTRPTSDLQTIALACDVQRAAQARGHGWEPDELGWPHLVPVPDVAEPAAPVREQAPATPAEPADVVDETGAWVGAWSAVSPENPVLAAVRAGRRPLGATVAQIITAIRREREAGWSTTHKVNMSNVLGFIEQLLVYEEPVENDTDADLPEVAAWMRARLALPGVEPGGSIHVALLLTPDLTLAIERRKNTDRRVERLNEMAVQRYLTLYERYERLMADRALKPRGGRAPKPPAAPVARVPKIPCEARTEELFATGLAMVLGYAEQHGLLAGPNPWHAFVARGSSTTGYRRSKHVPPHLRNVPPVGSIVQIADVIAQLGPIDPRTGRPVGERYRALVLLLLAGLRPTEADALGPDDFRQHAQPAVFVSKSAGVVLKAAAAGDTTFEVRPFGKTGKVRLVPIATYVADALRAHIAAGYASDDFLFTGPDGGPVRWGNLIETYWRPAVQQVLGSSADPILQDMPRKWIRKVAITWMLRAGLGVEQVAGYTGHDVVTLFHHYSGVVAGHGDRHTWAGWDSAWQWAVQETTLP